MRHRLVIAVALAASTFVVASISGTFGTPASAAPNANRPFACSPSAVFVSEADRPPGEGVQTHLLRGEFGQNSVDFEEFPTDVDGSWNAMAYNPDNGLLYVVTTATGGEPGHLMRIDADGDTVDIATLDGFVSGSLNMGAFDDSGRFWVGNNDRPILRAVNPDDGQIVETVRLTDSPGGSDMSFAAGAMWTVTVNGPDDASSVTQLRRIDLSSGEVTEQTVSLGMAIGAYGATFTYPAQGSETPDLGVVAQSRGLLYRLAGIGTDHISKKGSEGIQQSGAADGTLCTPPTGEGLTDLQVETIADKEFVGPEGSITYTTTVSNLSPNASAFTLTQTVPTGLTPTESNGTSCQLIPADQAPIDGGTAQDIWSCTGQVSQGDTTTFSFRGSVQHDPAPAELLTTARVSPVEPEANTANNTATATTPVRLVVTVTPAAGQHWQYGDPDRSLTASYDGLIDGDTPEDLDSVPTCQVDLSTIQDDVLLGRCSGGDDDTYIVEYEPRQVTKNPAPLTISASDETMQDGDRPPEVSPNYVGWVYDDDTQVLSRPPTCSADATEEMTTCTDAALDEANAGNYTITYEPGALIVSEGQAQPVDNATPAGTTARPTPQDDPPQLAATGVNHKPVLLTGLALVLAGCVALAVGAIRRSE